MSSPMQVHCLLCVGLAHILSASLMSTQMSVLSEELGDKRVYYNCVIYLIFVVFVS